MRSIRTLPILALALTVALLIGGCGGGGDAKKTACNEAKTTSKAYRLAIARQGLKFFNTKFAARSVAAIDSFEKSVEAVARATSGVQRAHAEELVTALKRQRTTIAALARHDLKTADREAVGLNISLVAGVKNLAQTCPGIPPTVFKI